MFHHHNFDLKYSNIYKQTNSFYSLEDYLKKKNIYEYETEKDKITCIDILNDPNYGTFNV